jgi:predicted transcriptional regulator
MAARNSRVVTVSLPPELADEFSRIAEQEQRTRSELFREMLRVYGAQREVEELETLQRYGATRGQELGILSEADVLALLEEERGRHR